MKRLTSILVIGSSLLLVACQPNSTDTKHETKQHEVTQPASADTSAMKDQVENQVTDMAENVENNLTEVENAVAQAIAEQDYRLFMAAGRGRIILGIDKAETEFVEQHCGLKVQDGDNDNFKTAEDKERIRTLRDFAKQYNQLMLQHCKNKV